jgi:hypothetical protein
MLLLAEEVESFKKEYNILVFLITVTTSDIKS